LQSKKIQYGVIGAGHIGNYHAQQIKNIANVKLIGIYDVNFKQAQKIADLYNVEAFNSLSSLLETCDAVSVATPAQTHFKIAILALQNNCHVFIEKPITTNLQEAEAIIQEAETLNKLVQVGHIERFNPAFAYLLTHQNISSSRFIESERLAPFNQRGLDVNVLLDLMIHDIDLILCIKNCGVKNIEAIGINVLSKNIDLANARITFEDNSVANLTASRISDTSVRKLRIFNKQQYFSLNLQNHSVDSYSVKTKNPNKQSQLIFSNQNKSIVHNKTSVPKQNALYEELASFISSIQTGKKIMVDASAGTEAIKLALLIQKKIHESTQT
tara:strand:- start:12513 stop:13496 length:984 start_codon:yes stop_codon:yes gene_type:complete